MFLKVLAFLAQNLERSYPIFMGGELQRKNNSFVKKKKKKKRKKKLNSFFLLFLIYFLPIFMVTEVLVWFLAHNGWIVCGCLLPDPYGQTEEMAKIRLLSSAIVMDVFDSRNIQDRSLLKVYNKDPAHAFNHTPKAVNGNMRVSVLVLFLLLFSGSNYPLLWHVVLV